MPAADHPEPATVAKPKRRWWQYSISSLLGLTLLVAVALAFVVNPARKQGQAVEYIESVGGSVNYASETKEGWFRAPEWWRETIGERYLRKVIFAGLEGTRVSDAGLAHLEALTTLEELYLANTQVSDAGLANVEGLTALKGLFLYNTQVTDAGLAHLEGLTALEVLDLGDTQVSDGGLEHLEGLTALVDLLLDNTQVSDAGLAHLEGLTALELLDLENTQVSDVGLADLQESLPNCRIIPAR